MASFRRASWGVGHPVIVVPWRSLLLPAPLRSLEDPTLQLYCLKVPWRRCRAKHCVSGHLFWRWIPIPQIRIEGRTTFSISMIRPSRRPFRLTQCPVVMADILTARSRDLFFFSFRSFSSARGAFMASSRCSLCTTRFLLVSYSYSYLIPGSPQPTISFYRQVSILDCTFYSPASLFNFMVTYILATLLSLCCSIAVLWPCVAFRFLFHHFIWSPLLSFAVK